MYWNKLIVKMKTMHRKGIIKITLIFLLAIPQMVMGQFTETKQFKKRFKVSPETRIELTNKYGKVEMNTWEKDSVVIIIDFHIEEKSLSKLEKSLDNIDFDTIYNNNYLIYRTVVDDKMGSLAREFQKLKETVFQSDGNMEINYTVWLPKTNYLKVENKFGDVFIGDYDGEVEITLSYGNLKAHDFNGNTNINLSFADATINEMKTGTLDCEYGELELDKAEQLKITSKSTTFEIDEIVNLDTDSRRDKFRFGQAENIDASGSFSNFRVDKLIDRATFRVEYGDLKIESIEPDFSSIYIESKSTDIDLGFDETSKFKFDITNTKSETRFSDKMNVTNEEVLDEKEGKKKLTGNFGTNTENEKLNINAVGGTIEIHNE